MATTLPGSFADSVPVTTVSSKGCNGTVGTLVTCARGEMPGVFPTGGLDSL